MEREVPEDRPGAEPGDDQVPEHSHGGPFDDPQPSAPPRPELDDGDDEDD